MLSAGIWIDHHKAVVLLISDDGEEMRHVKCELDTDTSSIGEKGAKHSYTRNDFVAEDRLERKAANRHGKYYDEVIDQLRDAQAILVLGPGEAKRELVKRIEARKIKGRITHVGTADKMTDPQFAAHLRELLGSSPDRQKPARG